MAESKKVKSEDVIEGKLFDPAKKSADKFKDSLDGIIKGFIKIIDEQGKFLQQNKGNASTLEAVKKLNEAIKKGEEARKGHAAATKIQMDLEKQELKLMQEKQKADQQKIKTEKEQETLQQKKLKGLREEQKAQEAKTASAIKTAKQEAKEIQQAKDREAKAQKALTVEAEKGARAAERLKKETEKLNSVYQKQSKELLEMKKRVKDILASEKELTDQDKKLIKDTQALDDKLKKIDKTLGDGHRSVGLYADGIKEAIAGTRLFDGELAHTLVQLKSLQKQWKENTEGTNRFSNAVKLAGVGLLVLAVAIAKALADAGKDMSQVLSDNLEKLDAIEVIRIGTAQKAAQAAGAETKELIPTLKLRNAYIDSLTKTTKKLEELSKTNQELALNEEDFRQIAADTTISLEARNAALLEAQAQEKKKLENTLEAEKLKLKLADDQLAVQEAIAGKDNAKLEFYAKQNEALKAVTAAQDALDDTIRLNDEEQRKLNIETASFEIDLILKKKQSANAEKVILENRLQDEKRQLEQRRKDAAQLLAVNRKTTAEEIKIFKEKTGIEFNEQKLIGEQDAVLLQRKLEGIKQTVINQKGETEQVGIGSEAIVLLAKIIKQAQENQIANAEEIKKLDEEEIKRKQKIADIEKEIAIIEQESIISQKEILSEQSDNFNEKQNEEILQQENVFSRKKLKLRKLAADIAFKNEVDVLSEQEKLLKLQRDKELQAIEDSINDDKIKAEEKLKIEAKYQADLLKLKSEGEKVGREAQDKETEELRKIEIRRTEIIVTQLEKITSALQNEVDKKNQIRVDEADKEISEREQAIDRQTQLAEDGLSNQLAFEIAAKNKAELEKREIEERAAREQELLQLTDAFFNAYNARLTAPGADPNTAAFQALGDVLLAKGVAKGLAGLFFEGTEKVEDDLKGNKVHNGRDGYVIGVDGSERIMTGEQNKMIGAMSNEDLANLAYSYQNGMLNNLNTSSTSEKDVSNYQVLEALAKVESAIKNKPVQIWEANKVGQLVEKRITDGFTKTITYVQPPYNYRIR